MVYVCVRASDSLSYKTFLKNHPNNPPPQKKKKTTKKKKQKKNNNKKHKNKTKNKKQKNNKQKNNKQTNKLNIVLSQNQYSTELVPCSPVLIVTIQKNTLCEGGGGGGGSTLRFSIKLLTTMILAMLLWKEGRKCFI